MEIHRGQVAVRLAIEERMRRILGACPFPEPR
jgi:hypothetical protein